MMDIIDAGFRYFYKEAGFGPIVDSTGVPDAVLTHYSSHLPHRLLEYWQLYGWAGFADGLFRLVNPDEYNELVSLWLAGSPFEHRDRYHVIARSAFGELFLWGERTADSLTIQTLYGQLFPSDRSKDIDHDSPQQFDTLIQEFMATLYRPHLDVLDDDNEPLFQRLHDHLGPLNVDEIYGRKPAYMLDHRCKLEHFQRVHAIGHMTLLAGISERYVMQDLNEVLQQARLKSLM